MKTAAAVGELMQAAFTLHGGEGDAGAVILGNGEKRKSMRIYISGGISKLIYEEAFEMFEHAERRELERNFQRHLDACRKCEIDPDPLWLSDAIEDMRSVR